MDTFNSGIPLLLETSVITLRMKFWFARDFVLVRNFLWALRADMFRSLAYTTFCTFIKTLLMVVILFTISETLLKLCTYLVHWIIVGKRLINFFICQLHPRSNIYCFLQIKSTSLNSFLWIALEFTSHTSLSLRASSR